MRGADFDWRIDMSRSPIWWSSWRRFSKQWSIKLSWTKAVTEITPNCNILNFCSIRTSKHPGLLLHLPLHLKIFIALSIFSRFTEGVLHIFRPCDESNQGVAVITAALHRDQADIVRYQRGSWACLCHAVKVSCERSIFVEHWMAHQKSALGVSNIETSTASASEIVKQDGLSYFGLGTIMIQTSRGINPPIHCRPTSSRLFGV